MNVEGCIMKNKKGISLIVLIITIIVVIILAATVIVALTKNNPVNSAKEATFKQDVRNFQDELSMYISNEYTKLQGMRDRKINTQNIPATFDEMKNYIENTTFLRELSTNNIVDINTGASYSNAQDNPYQSISKIFNFSNIESEDSDFNTHRRDVIKYSIERNLSIAISNFNNYSNASTDFQLPKLKDTDWDKIMDNISIISFMQGINIGGKVYNGYSIITNTINQDIVMDDSIYIEDNNTNTFHRITEENLNLNNVTGIYNVNLERRSSEDSASKTVYYFPVYGVLSYDSIVTQNKIAKDANQSINDYVSGLNTNLQKAYYTALGRERYGLYRQKLIINPS
mgnify:CR=1 FL=1